MWAEDRLHRITGESPHGFWMRAAQVGTYGVCRLGHTLHVPAPLAKGLPAPVACALMLITEVWWWHDWLWLLCHHGLQVSALPHYMPQARYVRCLRLV